MLRAIEHRLTLTIANPYAPMQVYVSTGPATGMVMITQTLEHETTHVVALVSRSLTAYEASRPPLEQKLHIARWALHRCIRFTATSPTITIHIPDPAHVVVLRDKVHHLRLEALLIDLASYKASYGQGDDT